MPGKFYAVVVGVGEYRHPLTFPNLRGAREDAQRIAAVLADRGFTVWGEGLLRLDRGNGPLIDPSFHRLKEVLKAAGSQLREDDTVLVYFAGHGYETLRAKGEGGTQGPSLYLIPPDARETHLRRRQEDEIWQLDRLRGYLMENVPVRPESLNLVWVLDACRKLHPEEEEGWEGEAAFPSSDTSRKKDAMASFAQRRGVMTLPSDAQASAEPRTAWLMACSTGESAHESRRLDAGAFGGAFERLLRAGKPSLQSSDLPDIVRDIREQGVLEQTPRWYGEEEIELPQRSSALPQAGARQQTSPFDPRLKDYLEQFERALAEGKFRGGFGSCESCISTLELARFPQHELQSLKDRLAEAEETLAAREFDDAAGDRGRLEAFVLRFTSGRWHTAAREALDQLDHDVALASQDSERLRAIDRFRGAARTPRYKAKAEALRQEELDWRQNRLSSEGLLQHRRDHPEGHRTLLDLPILLPQRRDEELWKRVLRDGRVHLLEHYVQEVTQRPEEYSGRHLDEARQLIDEERLWEPVQSHPSLPALEDYERSSKLLRHREEALKLRDEEERLWTSCQSAPTLASLEHYRTHSVLKSHALEVDELSTTLRQTEAHEREDEALWSRAVAEDSIESYERYLKDSRSLHHSEEASTRIQSLLSEEDETFWAQTVAQRTVSTVDAYLAHTRVGRHRQEAEQLRRTLLNELRGRENEDRQWTEAASADSVEGYRSYLAESVLLLHETEARQRLTKLHEAIDDEAWERTRTEDTLRAYADYEARFSSGKHRAACTELMAACHKEEELWQTARTTNTVSAHEAYLQKSSRRTHASEATACIQALNEAEDELGWQKARSTDTLAALEAFQRQMKTTVRESDVRQRISALTADAVAAEKVTQEIDRWARAEVDKPEPSELLSDYRIQHVKTLKHRQALEDRARQAPMARDACLWREAEAASTVAAFQHYLRRSPLCTHRKEAEAKIRAMTPKSKLPLAAVGAGAVAAVAWFAFVGVPTSRQTVVAPAQPTVQDVPTPKPAPALVARRNEPTPQADAMAIQAADLAALKAWQFPSLDKEPPAVRTEAYLKALADLSRVAPRIPRDDSPAAQLLRGGGNAMFKVPKGPFADQNEARQYDQFMMLTREIFRTEKDGRLATPGWGVAQADKAKLLLSVAAWVANDTKSNPDAQALAASMRARLGCVVGEPADAVKAWLEKTVSLGEKLETGFQKFVRKRAEDDLKWMAKNGSCPL